MAEEPKESAGLLRDAFKALNDALYAPALFSGLLLAVILLSGKDSTGEDWRRRLAVTFASLAAAQMFAGFVHNQLKWRAIHRQAQSAIEAERKSAEHALLGTKSWWAIIILHFVAVVAAIAYLLRSTWH